MYNFKAMRFQLLLIIVVLSSIQTIGISRAKAQANQIYVSSQNDRVLSFKALYGNTMLCRDYLKAILLIGANWTIFTVLVCRYS